MIYDRLAMVMEPDPLEHACWNSYFAVLLVTPRSSWHWFLYAACQRMHELIRPRFTFSQGGAFSGSQLAHLLNAIVCVFICTAMSAFLISGSMP